MPSPTELQFQLTDVFDILGYEGYELHQEIIEVEEACAFSYRNPNSNIDQSASKGIEGDDKAKSTNTGAGERETSNNSVAPNAQNKQHAISPEAEPTSEATSDGKNAEGSAVEQAKSKKCEPEHENTTGTAESSTAKDEAAREKPLIDESNATADDKSHMKTNDAFEKPSETVETTDSDHDSDSFHPFETVNRQDQLRELRNSASGYSRQQLLTAIRAFAIDMAASKTRDVPIFFCLHFISVMEAGSIWGSAVEANLCGHTTDLSLWPLFCPVEFKESALKVSLVSGKDNNGISEGDETERMTDAIIAELSLEISRECLLRCLAITNQGTSVGMTGWLEYGADNSFGRISDRPFETLHQLACNLASRNDWGGALDVLEALVSRCEQHLPLYHPTTLSSLLDLAGAARMNSNKSLENKVISSVAEKLAFYLVEQENNFFSNVNRSSQEGRQGEIAVLRFDNGIDGIMMLRSFVEMYEAQASRAFLRILCGAGGGSCDDLKFINHCLLADAMSVLANCMLAAERLFGASSDVVTNSRYYWRRAYSNYEAAFKGWVGKKHSIGDDCVFSAVYGISRCLRELGQRQKSMQILSSVVSALEKTKAETEAIKEEATETYSNDAFCFLPSRHSTSRKLCLTKSCHYGGRKEYSMALCLWLMATLAVEDSPNERGRIRALSLLHAASEELQTVLSASGPGDSMMISYKQKCYDILMRVEQEAKELLEPWEAATSDFPSKETCDKKEGQESQWKPDQNPSVSI